MQDGQSEKHQLLLKTVELFHNTVEHSTIFHSIVKRGFCLILMKMNAILLRNHSGINFVLWFMP